MVKKYVKDTENRDVNMELTLVSHTCINIKPPAVICIKAVF
jgi:hypothetical protein